ncbi:MAG TPA: phosphatase PAP2 family protein [Actinomycetes bacterium]|nr:phosphatase PAP2 family protein [Actinomycetes bacterium]
MGGWLLLLAIVIPLGLLITGPLADSWLTRADERLPERWENARTATLNSWTVWASGMGETVTVVSIASIVGIALLMMRRWGAALLLATAMVLEVTAFVVTTLFVERDRPDVHQLDVSPPTSSYPSGHTAASFALYATLALLVTLHTRSIVARVCAWTLAVAAALTVGAARIYRGMHHPSDVLAGLLVGAACVTIAFLAVRAWDRVELLREVSE